MYCLTHWQNKCDLDQVQAHNYIVLQPPTQQAIQCLCQIYACCAKTDAKWLNKNCWDSRVSLYCFCALLYIWATFYLLLSTRKPDLPSYGAAAWGALFITSDSTHIISKLLLFSIYWDGHLWREKIPIPKVHSVSVFLLRLLTRGN